MEAQHRYDALREKAKLREFSSTLQIDIRMLCLQNCGKFYASTEKQGSMTDLSDAREAHPPQSPFPPALALTRIDFNNIFYWFSCSSWMLNWCIDAQYIDMHEKKMILVSIFPFDCADLTSWHDSCWRSFVDGNYFWVTSFCDGTRRSIATDIHSIIVFLMNLRLVYLHTCVAPSTTFEETIAGASDNVTIQIISEVLF